VYVIDDPNNRQPRGAVRLLPDLQLSSRGVSLRKMPPGQALADPRDGQRAFGIRIRHCSTLSAGPGFSDSIVGIAYVAVMMGILGSLRSVLASVGVYGVMSYAVSERTNEIGVRMAMGATASDIQRLVLGKGAVLTLVAWASDCRLRSLWRTLFPAYFLE